MANYKSTLFLTVIFPIFITGSFGIEDYCSINRYPSHSTHMQFTKEPSTAEFSVIGKFKGLHCCAKGYRSIEWYKDGRPYPWHGTVSELIIYPESANQTVYTQTVKAVDAGNYTCLLRNDSVVHAHTIQLTVFDKVPDDPKITYISDNKEVCVGQPARLFCEAFVGRVDLPDAYNEAIWRKEGENATLQNQPHIRQEKISREDGQTFGTYLIIETVTKDDYGEYICTISKPGRTIELSTSIFEMTNMEYYNPNPVPIKRMLTYGSVLVIALLTVLFLYLRYGLSIRVHLKDRFGTIENNDDKINDILIVYSHKDSELALGVLLPQFESHYSYKCGSRELPENINQWGTHLYEAALKSHRIVALISPAAVNEKWESAILYQALKQLQDLDSQFCCVALKQLPLSTEAKNSQGETLYSITRKIHVIQWERSNDDRFWLSLRLWLPPKRFNEAKLEHVNVSQSENSKRLNSNDQDSLDVFV